MSEDDEHDKDAERRKKEDIKIIRGIANCLENVFKRQSEIDDPCLRSCLFVDKLSLSLDIAMGVLLSMTEEDIPLEIRQQILRMSKTVNEELSVLMQWVRSPVYSPDHPFGNNLVKNTSFYKNAENNDE